MLTPSKILTLNLNHQIVKLENSTMLHVHQYIENIGEPQLKRYRNINANTWLTLTYQVIDN